MTKRSDGPDRRRVERLERATENITRLAVFLPSGVAKIRLWSEGQPKAQDYEPRSGPRTVLYCDDHDRDQDDCKRLGLPCTGEPLPNASDPTGEAAIRQDIAAGDLARLDQLIAWLDRNSDEAIDLLARYARRDPTDKDTRESGEGELGCASCWRIQGPNTVHWWNAPYRCGPTDVGGALQRKHLLCRACEEFVRALIREGSGPRLPTNDELVTKRDTGKWPKRHDHPRVHAIDQA
jgi:hypothetical protein